MPASQPKLLDQIHGVIRSKHYSRRTEQSYIDWITRYVRFHGTRHPRELGANDIAAFLSHLAVDLNVAAATQNQARSALLFLYREVLSIEMVAPLGQTSRGICPGQQLDSVSNYPHKEILIGSSYPFPNAAAASSPERTAPSTQAW